MRVPALSREEKERVELLAKTLGVSSITGELLFRRGFKTPEEAWSFLHPSLDQLIDPFCFSEMEKAVKRVGKALRELELIQIYGDYDVDGITSTAILAWTLRFLGGKVLTCIPHRLREGYGLHKSRVLEAKQKGVSLLICVDTGITAASEIEMANALGMDVIVVDHHTPQEEIPKALAVLNPKLPGETYPFRELSGAGVAWKFALALLEKFCSLRERESERFRQLLNDLLALASLGTVADLVPLMGENRIITCFGLVALEKSSHPGLHVLLDTAGVRHRSLHPYDVSFSLAPLLNAAGRLGEAEKALKLFESRSTQEAYKVGKYLRRQNRIRQSMCREVYQDALRKMEKFRKHRGIPPLWVLSSKDWHPGILGIVASRLAHEEKKPVVLISEEGEVAKGSARSLAPCSVFSLLSTCDDLFSRFGGHEYAAGFEIPKEKIKLLEKRLFEQGEKVCPFEEKMQPDMEISFASLSSHVARELQQFAPFGFENEEPQFLSRGVLVASPLRKQTNGRYTAFLRQGKKVFRAFFPPLEEKLEREDVIGCTFHLRLESSKEAVLVIRQCWREK